MHDEAAQGLLSEIGAGIAQVRVNIRCYPALIKHIEEAHDAGLFEGNSAEANLQVIERAYNGTHVSQAHENYLIDRIHNEGELMTLVEETRNFSLLRAIGNELAYARNGNQRNHDDCLRHIGEAEEQHLFEGDPAAANLQLVEDAHNTSRIIGRVSTIQINPASTADDLRQLAGEAFIQAGSRAPAPGEETQSADLVSALRDLRVAETRPGWFMIHSFSEPPSDAFMRVESILSNAPDTKVNVAGGSMSVQTSNNAVQGPLKQESVRQAQVRDRVAGQ